MYDAGTGRSGSTTVPARSPVTVVAVRVTSPADAVTVSPPSPPKPPRESVPRTVPDSVATPLRSARFTVRVPSASSRTSTDWAPRRSVPAVTR